MKVFYVVYFRGVVGDCLNAIRMFADSAVKHPAHLTVRGPYEREIEISPTNAAIHGAGVVINGIGRFSHPNDEAVYFACDAPALQAVSWRPDYPEFVPHITIWRGSSVSFARALTEIAHQYSYQLAYRIDALELLITGNVESSRPTFNDEQIRSIVQEEVSGEAIVSLSPLRRLGAIDRLLRYLAHLSFNLYGGSYEISCESLGWDEEKKMFPCPPHDTVRAILVDADRRVLIGKRSRGLEAGKWALIGGKRDTSELPEEAVRREVAEELRVIFYPEALRRFNYARSGDPSWRWSLYVFTGRYQGIPTPKQDEVSELAFVTQETFDQFNFAFNHRALLQTFFSGSAKKI